MKTLVPLITLKDISLSSYDKILNEQLKRCNKFEYCGFDFVTFDNDEDRVKRIFDTDIPSMECLNYKRIASQVHKDDGFRHMYICGYQKILVNRKQAIYIIVEINDVLTRKQLEELNFETGVFVCRYIPNLVNRNWEPKYDKNTFEYFDFSPFTDDGIITLPIFDYIKHVPKDLNIIKYREQRTLMDYIERDQPHYEQ